MALDLQAIRKRAEAATPGPWLVGADWTVADVGDDQLVGPDGPAGRMSPAPADADFIAHARSDVPALVAEVERLRVLSDRLAAALGRVPSESLLPSELAAATSALLTHDGDHG